MEIAKMENANETFLVIFQHCANIFARYQLIGDF